MRRIVGFLAVAACATSLAACNSSMDLMDTGGLPSGNGGPGMGATQGGVQDMSFARRLVEQGMVPPPEAFIVEAMFSEHDLPLEGPACSTTLCLRAAMGVAPDAQSKPAAWVQVGMSSTVDPEAFERPSLAVVATVDVSGSMGWDYTGSQTSSPGNITRALLHSIAAELDEGDRFAMVTYGSTVSEPLDWTHGDDSAIGNAIDALRSNGSTNMEAGLERAYQLAAQALGSADEVRIMLFTDVQPNVGATSADSFRSMAAAGADEGIGLTVFGVGLGMGAEVMTAMSHLRGGNAFSLMNTADVDPLMEDSWPWMVSPIAYDLSVSATPSDELQLINGYGFPSTDAEASSSFEVATVFLSKRKGALLLELAPVEDAALEGSAVHLELSYADAHGEPFAQSLGASYHGEALDERGVYMPQIGIAKAVPLAQLVAGMRDAAEAYAGDKAAAVAILAPVLERFAADAVAVDDADLLAETEFWPKLLELMQAGAEQGNFYPGQ